MFENEFNLSFNLHKAYTNIGIKDDDIAKMACIYNLTADEAKKATDGFDAQNKAAAEGIIKKHGAPHVSKKEIRIAYLGDSITSYRMSHRCIMQQLFQEKEGVSFADFSISGLKVTDLFTAYYPAIADYAPNIAVMMIGTNDMRITDDETQYTHTPIEHFERDVEYLAAKLKKIGCILIMITLPPFDMKKMSVALDGWHILYKKDVMDLYNEAIIRVASKYDMPLVDMRAIWDDLDAAEVTIEDGLHLNPRGHAILAEQVYQTLKPLL